MKSKLPLKIVTFAPNSFHLMLKVKINGKVANLVLDTGASHSALDLSRISKFENRKELIKNSDKTTGLGTNTMESHVLTLKKMKLGDICLFEYDALIVDLSHINKTYESLKLPQIDGVLGSDILFYLNAKIDFGKKMLYLKIK